MKNGSLVKTALVLVMAAFIGEVSYNFHQLQQIREAVAELRAQVDILLEDRRADSFGLDQNR